ncbi:outer membrane protein assembly factor BamE domain-containing protein [Pseudomonas syringae]|uniref:outer membrane protein assembly factor BamE domain-containing protein n=1 Tax=Pseudomonas syringae TaxID=317 RepID=UPI001012FCDB|nr:outer membrane protein assembly factor BamE [Pseudomonas syringae]RXU28025.1 cell envelope protein SmpA [Pseudomonas syringae]
MRPENHLLLWSALLCLPAAATASNVHRCEDASGKITFTTLGCPDGHSPRLQRAFNAPPGTRIDVMPPANTAQTARGKPADQTLVVVGTRDDGCGNRLSAEQRRAAIINQRTPPGMTQRDVESLLGRPDKVTNRNGELHYVYNQKKGRSNKVTFDENGCVKGKR